MQLSKEAILSLTKNEDSLIAGIIVSEREHIINQAIDYEHNMNRSDCHHNMEILMGILTQCQSGG